MLVAPAEIFVQDFVRLVQFQLVRNLERGFFLEKLIGIVFVEIEVNLYEAGGDVADKLVDIGRGERCGRKDPETEIEWRRKDVRNSEFCAVGEGHHGFIVPFDQCAPLRIGKTEEVVIHKNGGSLRCLDTSVPFRLVNVIVLVKSNHFLSK